MYRHLFVSIVCISFAHADETHIEKKSLTLNQNQSKNKLPTLEILPAGSILKNIRIPRFNKDYTNHSLLKAEQLEVISADEIKGTNVNICLFDDGGERTQTTMDSVSINQQTGLITCYENLTFESEAFQASSQGLAIYLEKHCGFLLGRNQTIIYIKESDSKINSKDKATTMTQPNKITTTAVVAASTLVTAPTLLTAQDISKIDTLTQPSTEQFIAELDNTKEVLKATAASEAKIAAIRKELEEQLANAPKVHKNPVPPELVPIKDREFVKITSDKLLFDADQGIFVYFGNVKITHPKYSFTCDGELKIILKQHAKVKKMTAEQRAELDLDERFDLNSVEHIIASKNVILRAKDDNGKDITAVTNSLIAQNINRVTVKDKKSGKEKTTISGDIILKGKGSRLNTANSQMKVRSSKGYIKIDKDLNASGVDIDTDLIIPEDKDKKKPNNP